MAITPTDFKARFPEFSLIDDVRVQIFIDDAALEMSESAWNILYNKGLAYLTAHLLTIANKSEANGGSGGTNNPVASHSVEGVSESFAVPTLDDATNNITSTSYGQEYARLLRLIGRGAFVV